LKTNFGYKKSEKEHQIGEGKGLMRRTDQKRRGKTAKREKKISKKEIVGYWRGCRSTLEEHIGGESGGAVTVLKMQEERPRKDR